MMLLLDSVLSVCLYSVEDYKFMDGAKVGSNWASAGNELQLLAIILNQLFLSYNHIKNLPKPQELSMSNEL